MDHSILSPRGPNADHIATLWWILLTISVVVCAAVIVLVLMAVLRRRAAPEATAARPDAHSGNRLILFVGVLVPFVVLAVVFALTLGALSATSAGREGKRGRFVVGITARQWFWDVSYPGLGFRTSNEIHIPAGRPVEFRVRSKDVIHSFWIPSLGRKVDAIPGRTNRLVLTASRPGHYAGFCAELCGLQHAHMGFVVVADGPADFRAWAANQSQGAVVPATALLRTGEQQVMGSACVYCHTIRGTNASGRIGPDLTHLASRSQLAGNTIPLTRGYLASWLLDPQHIKPGNKIPGTDFSGRHLQEVLDYLMSLR
jgi:cytochrome c oxidase subunit 2